MLFVNKIIKFNKSFILIILLLIINDPKYLTQHFANCVNLHNKTIWLILLLYIPMDLILNQFSSPSRRYQNLDFKTLVSNFYTYTYFL